MDYLYKSYESFSTKESKQLTDIELLEKYKPTTYISKTEKYDLVNAIDYFQNNKINYDNSIMGSIVYNNNKTYLYYFYSFEEDGGKNILNIKTVDAHKDDIEVVIIELTGDNITGLCYMPHAPEEHFWIRDKNDLNTIIKNSTHPQAYIANSKHSVYPISGPIYRYFFLGNDNCSNPIIKNTKIILINSYLLKKHSIGRDGNIIGFGRRIAKNTNDIEVIRLDDLKFRKLFGK